MAAPRTAPQPVGRVASGKPSACWVVAQRCCGEARQQHGAQARTSTSMSSSASAVYTRAKMICARVASSSVSNQRSTLAECASRDSVGKPTHVAQHGLRVQVVALRCPVDGDAASATHARLVGHAYAAAETCSTQWRSGMRTDDLDALRAEGALCQRREARRVSSEASKCRRKPRARRTRVDVGRLALAAVLRARHLRGHAQRVAPLRLARAALREAAARSQQQRSRRTGGRARTGTRRTAP